LTASRSAPAQGRAVVTGAAGFLGSHLCRRLRERGVEVVGVDNFATGTAENLAPLTGDPGFALIRADVCDGLSVSGPISVIFHLASPASPRDYARLPLQTLRAGAQGTEHGLELAEKAGARFVLASSSEVYGDPLAHPQIESYWGNVNPVGPRSVYDEAKRYAEALATTYHEIGRADTAIARIFNTYGPGMRSDDGRAVPTFAHQAAAHEPITVAGDGTQTRSLCFVDDTVEGLLALAASTIAGPVNLGNPHEITMLALAETIRTLTGSSSPIIHVPLPVDDPARRCPDITLARTLLSWHPRVQLAEGLCRTLAGYGLPVVQPAGGSGGAR
jgi:dTDP-glucose 4,6-dehydratase